MSSSKTPADKDVASAMVEALAGEGRAEESGRFTLDPRQALRKLRAHQLVDPYAYLQVLVEAAWVAGDRGREGALKLERGATTWIELPELRVEAEELATLFSLVFSTRERGDEAEGRRLRALQFVALAASNALALEPDAILVEGRDGAGVRHRVRFDGAGEASLEPASELPGLRVGFCGQGLGLARRRAEARVLEEACRWSSFPIFVDGERVSLGPEVDIDSKDLVDSRSIRPLSAVIELPKGVRGVAGYAADLLAPGRAVVVNRGVAVVLPGIRERMGFIAVVEADLPMDLSRRRLLEDPELEAIVAAVEAARDSLAIPIHGRSEREAIAERARRASPAGQARARRTRTIALAVGAGVVVTLLGIAIPYFLLAQRKPVRGWPELLAECWAGLSVSCRELGNTELEDPQLRLILATLGCDRGAWPEPCVTGAELLLEEFDDPDGARELFVAACHKRNARSCDRAADMTDDPAQRERLRWRRSAMDE